MLLLRLQEKHTQEQLRDHLKSVISTQDELRHLYGKITEVQARIRETHQRQLHLLATHGSK